ncbi:MAG: kelch repeat-containing protein [bacterium]
MKKKFNISRLINLIRKSKILMICSLIFLLCIVGCAIPSNSNPTSINDTEMLGHFEKAGSLKIGRYDHTATLLQDGRILIIGGRGGAEHSTLNQAEIYDPTTKKSTKIGRINVARCNHTATLLKDGRVLITGGTGQGNQYNMASAEIFDPVTNTFKKLPDMNYKRSEHSAILLPNGKILISGGRAAGNTAELFDPETERFSITSNLSANNRYNHNSVLLKDGRILLDGGGCYYETKLSTKSNKMMIVNENCNIAETYNHETEMFIPLKSKMNNARRSNSITVLKNGKVLITGGEDISIITGTSLKTAEILDPETETWQKLPDMNYDRVNHKAMLLKNGNVLIIGGIYPEFIGPEVYDPVKNKFFIIKQKTTKRASPQTVILTDGSVVIIGGAHYGDGVKAIEIYKENK